MQNVDILLATYNGERYIDDMLKSIADQSYTNWRLIVRDDGSVDNTIDKLQEFANRHFGKVWIISDGQNIGVVRNFATLMSLATSEYIFFADQDDVWHPDKLVSMISIANGSGFFNDEPVLIHTDLTVVDSDLKVIASSFFQYQGLNPARGLLPKDLMIQNCVTGCAMMINKKLRDLSLPIPEGACMHDWWIAMVASTFGTIKLMNKPTLFYRQHGKNDTGAKRYSIVTSVKLLGKYRTINASIRRTELQAQLFYQRFGSSMSREEASMMNIFASIRSHNFFMRRLIAARLNLKKHGLLRTVGFYLFL